VGRNRNELGRGGRAVSRLKEEEQAVEKAITQGKEIEETGKTWADQRERCGGDG